MMKTSDARNIGEHRLQVRNLLILGSLLVLIGIAAASTIPRLLDADTYRSTIEAEASRRLGRPLSFTRIELIAFPWPTAVIHDVTVVGQGLEGKAALTAPTLRARARLIPLVFARRFEFIELALDQAEIALVRGPSGRWNWQDMLEREGKESSGREGPAASSWNDERLAITNATIRVIDQQAEPGQTIRFTMAPLDLALRRNGDGHPLDVGLDCELISAEGRGTFRFKGQIGPLPVPFDAARLPLDGIVKADGFPLRAILPYIRREHGVRALGGMVTSDLRVAMRPGSRAEAKGHLKLVKVHYEFFGPPVRSGTLDLDSSLDLSSMNGRKDLDIRHLDLALPGSRLSISGEIREASGGSRLSLKVDGSHLSLGVLAPMATLAGVELPLDALGSQPFDVDGSIERHSLPDGASRLVLRDLHIRGVEGSLYRDVAGYWSWQRVVPQRVVPPRSPASPTRLEVERLQVERSTLIVRDAIAGHGRPMPVRLTGLEIKVDQFGTGSPSHGTLRADLPGGGRIKVEGTVGPEANGQWPTDAEVRLEQAPVTMISPYLSTAGGPESAAGTIDLDTSIRGRAPERLAVKGTLALREVSIDLKKPRGGTTHQILRGDVVFDAILDGGGQQVTFNSGRVSLPSGAFAFSGTLDRRGGGNRVDMAIAPTRLNVEDLQPLASFAGFSFPGTMRSPDPLEVTVRARGNLADRSGLYLTGSLRATRLTWDAPFLRRPLENIDADVRLTGDGFEASGFSATLGETAVRGDVGLRDFGAPQITFAITSDRADLSQLLGDLAGKTDPGQRTSAGAQPDPTGRITGRGTVFIKSGTFNTLSFSDLHGAVTMQGRTIRLAPLEFALYGGKYAGESAIDLRGEVPIFEHNCTLTTLDANALLSAATNLKDVLHGTLSGRLGANGAGKTMDAVVRSLDGSGDFTVVDGVLTRSSMLKGLSEVAGLFGERTLTQLSQRMTTNETPFSTLSASFRVAGGQLTTDNLHLQSKDFTLTAKGRIGLDRHLGFNGRIVFSDLISRSLKAEGSRAVYLGAEGERVAVPVSMGGTIDRPSFAVDFGSAAAYAVTKTITDRLAEELMRRQTSPGVPRTFPDTIPARPPRGGADTAPNPGRGDTATAATPHQRTTPPPTAPAPTDLRVQVGAHQFRGNPLKPDLAVTGEVAGSRLASLLVVVRDDRGRVVHRETRLTREIAAAYGERSRSERVTVPFSIRISGSRLPPFSTSVSMTLFAVSDQGATSPPVSIAEKRPSLF